MEGAMPVEKHLARPLKEEALITLTEQADTLVLNGRFDNQTTETRGWRKQMKRLSGRPGSGALKSDASAPASEDSLPGPAPALAPATAPAPAPAGGSAPAPAPALAPASGPAPAPEDGSAPAPAPASAAAAALAQRVQTAVQTTRSNLTEGSRVHLVPPTGTPQAKKKRLHPPAPVRARSDEGVERPSVHSAPETARSARAAQQEGLCQHARQMSGSWQPGKPDSHRIGTSS